MSKNKKIIVCAAIAIILILTVGIADKAYGDGELTAGAPQTETEQVVEQVQSTTNLKAVKTAKELKSQKKKAIKWAKKQLKIYKKFLTKAEKKKIKKQINKISKAKSLKQIKKNKKSINKLLKSAKKKKSFSSKSSHRTTITRSGGVYHYGGRLETYYSSRVLYHYRTHEWVNDSEGFWRTKDGYYVVACSDKSQGTVFRGSKGLCKVLDSGCAAGTTDYYVSW